MTADTNTTDQARGRDDGPEPSQPTRQGLLRSLAHRLAGDSSALPDEGPLAPFDGATTWLNSDPLTPEGLRGRVVLVDFWTYTCINWLRTLPYVRAWNAKYRELGLTVVGVHTPEFSFERTVPNIVKQSAIFGVDYPIAVDSDYSVWRAFSNHFWPAVYIADAQGRIRYHHFGEGEYAMQEMVIQELLIEAGTVGVERDLVEVDPRGLEVAADYRTLRSPESYLGYLQAAGFASDGDAEYDQPRAYTARPRLPLNAWDLSGSWTYARHASILNEPGGRVVFQFQARDVNLVMGPATPGAAIPFRVYLDGQVAADAHGSDVAPDGSGVLTDQRTYQLIRQAGAIAERRFEIEFLDAGAEAYCFTFG
jgi:thiol-disulfide isomerase/thioredoxin